MTQTAAKETKDAAKNQTAKVTITLHGQDYIVACGAGEEKKLADLVKIVDDKLNALADRTALPGASETRLFMLTCLMLADELTELRRLTTEQRKADETLMVAAVDHLRNRVLAIAEQISAP